MRVRIHGPILIWSHYDLWSAHGVGYAKHKATGRMAIAGSPQDAAHAIARGLREGRSKPAERVTRALRVGAGSIQEIGE